MNILENRIYPEERALYAARDLCLKNCRFEGEEDGESALKESKNVRLEGCFMDLRYPLWHDEGVELISTEMTEKCRAPLWYTDGVRIRDSILHGVKALRECGRIQIEKTEIVSPEFGWRSRDIVMRDCSVEGEYLFLQASGIEWENVRFKGKYSFQYVENAVIENCSLDTKDAFWHTKNVTVRNSLIRGEYLAWYSEGLTLENCTVVGTQPLCYCKGLKLIDCRMEEADFSFEYSEVEASVNGSILSVKNPRKGRITADGYGEILLTADSVYPCECEILTRK